MFRLWALLMGLMIAAPALADQRVALVIGNDAYSSVPVLQKAAADARTMAASLSKLGFDVDSGVNVSRTETNGKLQNFLNRIEPGDVALLYFAGHGVEIAGANYLLPIDIPEATPGNEQFLKSEAISLNAVLDGLRQRKARRDRCLPRQSLRYQDRPQRRRRRRTRLGGTPARNLCHVFGGRRRGRA